MTIRIWLKYSIHIHIIMHTCYATYSRLASQHSYGAWWVQDPCTSQPLLVLPNNGHSSCHPHRSTSQGHLQFHRRQPHLHSPNGHVSRPPIQSLWDQHLFATRTHSVSNLWRDNTETCERLESLDAPERVLSLLVSGYVLTIIPTPSLPIRLLVLESTAIIGTS